MQDLTLVLDIGKSNAKLVLIDSAGKVLGSVRTANESTFDTERGYLALGTERIAAWLQASVPGLLKGRAPSKISVTTHGAAFCALGEDGLVLPPIDYEWDGYADITAAFDASLSNFAHHGTPRLPLGLNAGRQIDYVQRRWPKLAGRIRCWLPYPQYWAWWLSGVAVSEVSSLGCHTGLWAPADQRFSDWAQARGVAAQFAPMRQAWEVIGPLRPALVEAWELPRGAIVEVLAGVHDSNACLARYLRDMPDATVVSTGTWCIVMAPGADMARLSPQRDELVNVAVDGRAVATARFMGGREFAALCDGADPALATPAALEELVREGWMALPAFSESGGPFMGRRGRILRHGASAPEGVAAVPLHLKPALAGLYCALVSALLVDDLTSEAAAQPVILEGPLAQNEAYRLAMACLLEPRPLYRSNDALEGTARGAWMLARWEESGQDGAALEAVRNSSEALCEIVRTHGKAWRIGKHNAGLSPHRRLDRAPSRENTMPEAYIVAAVRTAGAKRKGRLAGWHPVDLAAQIIDELVARTGADPAAVDDVFMGCVSQIGEQATNVARNAVLASKLPESVPGTSIDRQCGSSQQAIHFAAQAVMSGAMDVVIAAGVESMTRVPMGSPNVLAAQAGMGSYQSPAVNARYDNVAFSQFMGAEMMARKYGFDRTALDAFSLTSHQKAIAATQAGLFKQEILALAVPGSADLHDTDEGIRYDATLESIASVKLLQEGGVITAANASQICDGASGVMIVSEAGLKALGVKPLARIHHMSVLGSDPIIMLETPLPATERALRRAGMEIEDIDLYEVNEAFASVPLAWLKQLDADPARLNINGGAIALGHPLGASGTKLMTTLVHALHQRGGRYGLQTMCEGGGMANVTIIERL